MTRAAITLLLAATAATLGACRGGGTGGATGGHGGHGAGGSGGAADAAVDGVCQSDLFVDWQIENQASAAVTCDAAGAATVVIDIDGASYPQACQNGHSSGSQDIVLAANHSSYNVTVSLHATSGATIGVPQQTTVDVTSCGSYATPGPAVLVVSTP